MWTSTIDARLMADDVALAYRRKGFDVRTAQFHHNFSVQTLASIGATARDSVAVNADGFFVWLATAMSTRGRVGASDYDALNEESALIGVGVRITDVQGSYQFTGPDRLPHQTLAGSAEAPYILGFPYIFRPTSRIQAEFLHEYGTFSADPVRVQLSLIGVYLWTTPYTRTVYYPEP